MREFGDLIDIKDVIEHEYVLEVSSPGLNRPLKKETDFLRAIGKKIKVKMILVDLILEIILQVTNLKEVQVKVIYQLKLLN